MSLLAKRSKKKNIIWVTINKSEPINIKSIHPKSETSINISYMLDRKYEKIFNEDKLILIGIFFIITIKIKNGSTQVTFVPSSYSIYPSSIMIQRGALLLMIIGIGCFFGYKTYRLFQQSG